MVDLFTYLKELSDNSDFKAELSTRGGFITFTLIPQHYYKIFFLST